MKKHRFREGAQSLCFCMCSCACVPALTTPAAQHPGWNAVGRFFAGGAGWRSVFLRAHLGPLLLQQVRQRPGDQQQSQRLNLRVDEAAFSETENTTEFRFSIRWNTLWSSLPLLAHILNHFCWLFESLFGAYTCFFLPLSVTYGHDFMQYVHVWTRGLVGLGGQEREHTKAAFNAHR